MKVFRWTIIGMVIAEALTFRRNRPGTGTDDIPGKGAE